MKFFLNARYRSEIITKIRYPKEVIQTSSATKENRYPRLFKDVSIELKDLPKPKILSFGCSTGEEVISIKEYIPNSQIVGVDINHRVLSKAKNGSAGESIRFYHYKDQQWKTEAPYDCVLALAVFQKSTHKEKRRKDASSSFTFNIFSQMIDQLNSVLKPGGCLVIEHSDFSFQDLSVSKDFSISKNDQAIKRDRPVFSEQNTLVSSSHESNRIFVKSLRAFSG